MVALTWVCGWWGKSHVLDHVTRPPLWELWQWRLNFFPMWDWTTKINLFSQAAVSLVPFNQQTHIYHFKNIFYRISSWHSICHFCCWGFLYQSNTRDTCPVLCGESWVERLSTVLKSGFIFTPVYQTDCSSRPQRWPPLSVAMLTADWSWRGNAFYFTKLTLQWGEGKRQERTRVSGECWV